MYNVMVGEETRTTAPGRRQAVRKAKEMSQKTHHPVRVLSGGGWERLVFRRGKLQSSTYITPDRRHKRDPLA